MLDTSFDDFCGLVCYRSSDCNGPKISELIKFEHCNTGSSYPKTLQSCISHCKHIELASDEWFKFKVYYGKTMYVIDDDGTILNGNGVYCLHHGEY